MKAVILNASAWMIVPFMDALAKYLSSSMDVLQITWARYFFTVVFALSIMLLFDRKYFPRIYFFLQFLRFRYQKP